MSTANDLLETALADWHREHQARMVDFAGWTMPIQYSSIVQEHTTTRTAASLFDVSHMGRFRFDGSDSGSFLDSILTRRVTDLQVNQIRYSLVTNENRRHPRRRAGLPSGRYGRKALPLAGRQRRKSRQDQELDP